MINELFSLTARFFNLGTHVTVVLSYYLVIGPSLEVEVLHVVCLLTLRGNNLQEKPYFINISRSFIVIYFSLRLLSFGNLR